MVGLGMLMLLLGLAGAWFRWRGQLYEQRLFLRFAMAMGPAGIIAMLAGWITTEIGRQPWVVYGVMRTADAASHHSALDAQRQPCWSSSCCTARCSAPASATC